MTGRPTAAQKMIDERTHKIDIIHKLASMLASEDPEKTFLIADLDRQLFTKWKVHPRTAEAYYSTLERAGYIEFNFTIGIVHQFADGVEWKPKPTEKAPKDSKQK